MAEALAILGLVSTIAQFVDFGAKIVERLNEFNSDVHEVPKTFQAIEVQLPLLIDSLHRTQQQASEGHITVRTATALKPLIEACCEEITALRIILDKAIPPKESSSWTRRIQALKSLAHDDDVERSIAKLESHIRILAFHQSTSVTDELLKLRISLQTHKTMPHPSRKPVFMVPFDRDETFVGRKDILDSIDQKLNASRRRAVLSGIGGVGYDPVTLAVSDLY
jgi:hypothetical protein